MKTGILLSLILLLMIFASCDQRECFICSKDCNDIMTRGNTLLITDFELAQDQQKLGTNLSAWKDSLSAIKVSISLDSTKEDGHFARLEIKDNNGKSNAGYTGGGLILNFENCAFGLDLSKYDTLQFDIKVLPGSNIRETKIKLEDTTKNKTPERFIIQFEPSFPQQKWQKVSIPLDWFNTQLPTDTTLHSWTSLDRKHVLRLVTVLIQEGSGGRKDGVLWIDNVRLVK